MTKDAFKMWLDAYGRAWETRDPDAATDLFTEDALYYETPFADPFAGRKAIYNYWADVPRLQTNITFRYEILSVKGDTGVARWWADFTRISSQKRVHLDGIFVITMADNGRCREFREWWHRQEKQPEESDAST